MCAVTDGSGLKMMGSTPRTSRKTKRIGRAFIGSSDSSATSAKEGTRLASANFIGEDHAVFQTGGVKWES